MSLKSVLIPVRQLRVEHEHYAELIFIGLSVSVHQDYRVVHIYPVFRWNAAETQIVQLLKNVISVLSHVHHYVPHLHVPLVHAVKHKAIKKLVPALHPYKEMDILTAMNLL